MDRLLTPAEAECLATGSPPALGTEEIALASAAGRTLASELTADRPLPPYDRVMMDGICFRSADLGEQPRLQVHGLHPAGHPEPAPLPGGSCWEVMTGACLPPDCDTVIPYEEIERPAEGEVSFAPESIRPGSFVHRVASDFAPGAVLVPAGTVIDARVASVAATVGATTLQVLRRPRVIILSTGDEVVPPDSQPAAHQVRQSNAPALHTALQRLGIDAIHHEHLPDDEEATSEAVRRSLDADLVLMCGGISKGKRDFVRPVLESLLGPPAFHGVAQRPGKPLAFWAGPPPIFALPGNPMAVLICFHRYVRPLLDKMAGRPVGPVEVRLGSPFRFEPPMAYFLPVYLRREEATLRADPHPLANSGDFASAIGTDGFIELPADRTDFPEGVLAPFHEWI